MPKPTDAQMPLHGTPPQTTFQLLKPQKLISATAGTQFDIIAVLPTIEMAEQLARELKLTHYGILASVLVKVVQPAILTAAPAPAINN